MIETQNARWRDPAQDDNLSTIKQSYIGSNVINKGTNFDHSPPLEKLAIAHRERRVADRIDLQQLAPGVRDRIRVEVKTGQGKVVVRPVDVSLTDICVESEHAIADQGANVAITLSYDGLQVVIPAIAVRHSRMYARSAFVFVGVNGDNKMHPDHPLGLIIHALEAQKDTLRLQRFACLMLGAVCSLIFTSWMFQTL